MRRPPDPGDAAAPAADRGGAQCAGGDTDKGDYNATRHTVARRLGPVLPRRPKSNVQTAPVAFIGTPARQLAGEILSGAKLPAEIAVELVDVLGPHTAILLAHEIAARVTRVTQEDTL